MRDFPYGYEVLLENLMDPAHVPYAHHGLMRTVCNPRPVDREGGRPLDISILSQDISGFLAKQEYGYRKFIAPCIFYASPFSGSANESISQFQKPAADDHKPQRQILLIFVCIPVSPGRSRLIWSFPRNFSVWIDKLVPRWIFHLGQNLILDSDLYLVHLETYGSLGISKAFSSPRSMQSFILHKVSDFQKLIGEQSSMDTSHQPLQKSSSWTDTGLMWFTAAAVMQP
ncbi:hypothetical protein AMTRI_Chr03g140700 [Amborella trichopoda]